MPTASKKSSSLSSLQVSKPPVATKAARSTASAAAGKKPHKPRKLKVDSSGTPTLYVDDRAGSADLMKHNPFDEVGQIHRLNSGDVCFAGNGPDGNVLVGVELKSIFDLTSSMNTGRLQATQLPAMLTHYHESWLLYYGSYRPGVHGELEIYKGGTWVAHCVGSRPVPYGYLEQFLLTVTACGVHVKHTYDLIEAAQWIACLARWWSKPWSEHRSMKAFDQSRQITNGIMPNVSESVLLRAKVAAALPGIGYDRAMAVAKHFSSVTEMVLATEKEWMAVPGIGKTIARSLRQSLE